MDQLKCERCGDLAVAVWECGCIISTRKPRCARHHLDGYECLSGDGFYRVPDARITKAGGGDMSAREQHFVSFLSPGSLFPETTTKPIECWDSAMAIKMARDIVERYDAKPYGFQFTTYLVHEPIDDGCGGKLEVKEKQVACSGFFYRGGVVENYDEVLKRMEASGKDVSRIRGDNILVSNMRCNDYPYVVTNSNSFRVTLPFGERDFVIDEHGLVLECGDDAQKMVYRAAFKERYLSYHSHPRAEF